jgi:membrane-associated phospholipid phosphatase
VAFGIDVARPEDREKSVTMSSYRRTGIVLFTVVFFSTGGRALNKTTDTSLIPIATVFHEMDRNLLGSFTYHYGLNYVVGCAASYGLVESGADWRWRQNAVEYPWISRTGRIAVVTGPLVSVALPLGLYLYGRSEKDVNLQITGLALGQAAIDAAVVTSVLKAFTGRVGPQHNSQTTDYSKEFRFGFLRGGIYQGWPSSHTAAAFSMATALMELYPGNAAITIGGLTYASFIGLGVSTNIHWFSDAVAGALIGYAIGSTVGSSFRSMLNHGGDEQVFDFSITPVGITFTYRF